MVVFPPCKINLGLNVVAKRTDGYHAIETCFYQVPWTDLLEVLPADKLKMETSGIAIPGRDEENICLKAYELLANRYQIPPIHIYLHKLIPIGAGLGGGSADGAYALKAMNSVFNLNLSDHQLKSYASHLGSDCAFFIDGIPALGTGRGEQLEPVEIDLTGKFLVLLKPDIHVSTASAYSGVIPKAWPVSVKEIITTYPVEQWRVHLRNDFEESVFRKYPEIKEIKEQLYQSGALYAAMSGSGSSVFGIFDSAVDLTKPDFAAPANASNTISWSGWL